MYRFALHYSDSNRETLSAFTSPDQIDDYLDDNKLLEEFLYYARESGVRLVPGEIKESEEIIITQLKAYISRNLLDNDGFYPIIEKVDHTLKEALKIIEKESLTD